jgi:hypothetical protein
MIVECVLIKVCIPITTARVANTSQIAQSVRNFFSVLVALLMKCRVDMLSIGNASDSWLPTIHGVLSVRKLQRLERE